jgi:hypothetical protein
MHLVGEEEKEGKRGNGGQGRRKGRGYWRESKTIVKAARGIPVLSPTVMQELHIFPT